MNKNMHIRTKEEVTDEFIREVHNISQNYTNVPFIFITEMEFLTNNNKANNDFIRRMQNYYDGIRNFEKINMSDNNSETVDTNQESLSDKLSKIYNNLDLNRLSNDSDWRVRLIMAHKGIKLDKLVNDPDWRVRNEVAIQGYNLDKLTDDPNPLVRAEVAKHGYNINKLIHDPDVDVRLAIARNCKQDELVDLTTDSAQCVRFAIAKRGFWSEILKYDKDYDVRSEAAKHLN